MPMQTLDKLKTLATSPAGMSDAQQCMRRTIIILAGDGTPEDKFVRLADAMRQCSPKDQAAVIDWVLATMPEPKGE